MKSVVSKTLIFLFLAFIFIVSLVPFLWVLFSSFRLNSDILSSNFNLSEGFTIQNYFTAFELAPIVTLYRNSIVVAIFGVLLNLVAMSMAAYVIARFQFRGKRFFRLLFSSSLLIPSAALLLPLFTTIKSVGLYDSLYGLIIVYAGFGLPTTLFIMSSYFLTIPKELEESAYLDGCGFVRSFTTIILPLAKPAFSTAIVLQFLLCWNEFQFALILTTGTQNRTIPIALYYFKSAFASDYGAMFAATVLVILPSILVYIAMQEQVVSGLAAGAVKG